MEFEAVSVGILSIVPPLVAIALALITKEVISSLLLGVLSGTLIYSVASGLNVLAMFHVTTDFMIEKVGGNVDMVIFLAILGGLVALVTRAGGSRAYGIWAAQRLKNARSTGIATVILGLILFIDDYFNCLAVGTVMRPVSDKHKISREKLAYLVDATAAPICIIAPVSSWAAAVISYYPNDGGMQAFISSIPMNLYALLTIFMIFWLSIRPQDDYGPMAKAQRRAAAGILGEADEADANDELANMKVSEKGLVLDLVLPVLALVVFSIGAMLYYGGFLDLEGSLGSRIFEAFGDTDAAPALALGGFLALIIAFVMYVPRKILGYKEFFAAITGGVKSMVPALCILTFAWTISGVCRYLLGTGVYVAGIVEQSNFPVMLIPVIMFVIACFLSFSTGTSWGTFGILIPISIAITEAVAPWLTITSLSAVLAGSVFGDHCSPISDTSILAATGSQCKLIDHVLTQMPYAVTVACVCVIGYIIAGVTSPMGYGVSVGITLPISLALLTVVLIVLPKFLNSKAAKA